MTKFIAFSPKVYAFEESRLNNSLIEHKKAKGTKKNVTKKSLCFDMYKQCLFENKTYGITTYPYGANAFMVCHEELIIKNALANYLDKLKTNKSP